MDALPDSPVVPMLRLLMLVSGELKLFSAFFPRVALVFEGLLDKPFTLRPPKLIAEPAEQLPGFAFRAEGP